MKVKKMMRVLIGACLAVFLETPALPAASLTQATVTETKNNVRLKQGAEERGAQVNDVIKGNDILQTGKKSRAELEFNDKSLARLGSSTVFSFDLTQREMQIKKGTALIHVPPGLKERTNIVTTAATVAVLGDVVMMRVDENGTTFIVALSEDEQGPIKVKLNRTGEERTLRAGEMFVIDLAATQLPDPRTIAVDVFMQTSGLANGFQKALPTTAKLEIHQTEVVQIKEIKRGSLENPGAVMMAKADLNTLTQSANMDAMTAVQSASGRSIAGRYVGTTTSNPPFANTDQLTLDIREDGSFNSTAIDAQGQTYTGLGTTSTDGSFVVRLSDGKTVTGNVKLGASTASGTYSDDQGGGTFTTSKQ